MSLRSRLLVPELMDAPDLDPHAHLQALRGLRRIQRISGIGKRIADAIGRIARKRRLSNFQVLDLGCGGGDVAIDVARRLSKQFESHITGWDISPTAIQLATTQATRLGSPVTDRSAIRFEVQDVFAPISVNSPAPTFDFVYCSLFLHHFSESQAVELLRRMKSLASVAVLVSDLQRSPFGLALATAGCRLLSRSPIVHFDGPQSVRAAFTPQELERLAREAELVPHLIHRHWPERILLAWERSS